VAYAVIGICREIVLKYQRNEWQKFLIFCHGFIKARKGDIFVDFKKNNILNQSFPEFLNKKELDGI
jgi:hypothetical protein